MNKRTLVVDQLYNLAAGFLYALSICYFARGSDFAPGGISGLALIVNYLWHLPVGITTLVFNLPLVALSIRFVGRAFLAKSLVSMVWCTVFQDVVFARVGCYTGDPLVAALFAGVTGLRAGPALHAGLFQWRHGFPHHVHQGAAAPPLHRGGHGRH